MLQIFYYSAATHYVSDKELQAILAVSRVNNARTGITGLLLFRGNFFFQLLEGEAAPVRALVEKIGRDYRHRDVKVLVDCETDTRIFPSWSMGYVPHNTLSDTLQKLLDRVEVLSEAAAGDRESILRLLKTINSSS